MLEEPGDDAAGLPEVGSEIDIVDEASGGVVGMTCDPDAPEPTKWDKHKARLNKQREEVQVTPEAS